MENSSSQSYTSMMNSSLSPSDPQSPNFLQNTQNQMSQQYPNFHPSHMNYPTPPFNPSFQPHYPHHANLYGAPGSYQPISPMHPSYHGVLYHGSGGMYPPGAYGAGSSNNPSSPVGCMPFLGVVGGTGSRGDESSSPGVSHTMSPPYPVSPAYPVSPVYPMSQDPAYGAAMKPTKPPASTLSRGIVRALDLAWTNSAPRIRPSSASIRTGSCRRDLGRTRQRWDDPASIRPANLTAVNNTYHN